MWTRALQGHLITSPVHCTHALQAEHSGSSKTLPAAPQLMMRAVAGQQTRGGRGDIIAAANIGLFGAKIPSPAHTMRVKMQFRCESAAEHHQWTSSSCMFMCLSCNLRQHEQGGWGRRGR